MVCQTKKKPPANGTSPMGPLSSGTAASEDESLFLSHTAAYLLPRLPHPDRHNKRSIANYGFTP